MIDNFHEIELLADVLEEHDAHVDVMLRITPGISAHTGSIQIAGMARFVSLISVLMALIIAATNSSGASGVSSFT